MVPEWAYTVATVVPLALAAGWWIVLWKDRVRWPHDLPAVAALLLAAVAVPAVCLVAAAWGRGLLAMLGAMALVAEAHAGPESAKTWCDLDDCFAMELMVGFFGSAALVTVGFLASLGLAVLFLVRDAARRLPWRVAALLGGVLLVAPALLLAWALVADIAADQFWWRGPPSWSSGY